MKPKWIEIAEKYIGRAEIPGERTADFITKALVFMGAWWRDDETPWCGVGAGACLKHAGVTPPKAYYRAKAYLDWGVKLDRAIYGCIVVFTRQGGGHVGFVVGKDDKNRLMVLGGNQGNKVSIAPFDQTRVAGYRWPEGVPLVTSTQLPLISSSIQSSSNEA